MQEKERGSQNVPTAGKDHLIVIAGAGGFMGQVLRLIGANETTVVGIDGGTALVYSAASWTVLGRGGVTLLTNPARPRYTAGQSLPELAR